MTKRIKRLNIILFFTICLTMLFSVTAHAKTAAYKKLYKKFLEKGTYEVNTVDYRTNYKNGKVVKCKTKTIHKIAAYALANIDGKGAPELILFSKYYGGKKPLRPNRYRVNVARIKGKKVKLIPTDYYTWKVGKKVYKKNSYTFDVIPKKKEVKFYPALSMLRFDTTYGYYDSDDKKVESWDSITYYEYKGGYLLDVDDYDDDEDSNPKLKAVETAKPSVAKILANTKKNRKKSFK